jgi:hypothetical protein
MPDYAGGSIVNLMASIIRALGGAAEYPPLRLLPPEDLAGHTNILLLVIDGLGAAWLAERSPLGILSRHQLGTLTSVFPTTTAAAITTFLTGDAPQQHGITGWFTYFRELGCVMRILPGQPRYGGVGFRQAGVDLAQLLGTRPIASRIPTRTFLFTPAAIAHSDFNLAHLGPARAQPFADLRDMFRQAARVLRADADPKYLYLYWPDLDRLGHETGMDTADSAAPRHLAAIERALADFMVTAAGTRTLVLVTADHGQIDIRPEDHIRLDQHPLLDACLALPLCGEPRAAFCYVRPGRVRDFEHYCQETLASQLKLFPSPALAGLGLYGLGEPHPRLQERMGDYTTLPTGHRVIQDRLTSEKRFTPIGSHGGLSERELMVPLCRLSA